MRKIGSVNVYGLGTYTIYLNSKDSANPYWVYKEYYAPGRYGTTKRKNIQMKYANLSSCVQLIENATRIAETRRGDDWNDE